MKRFLLLIIILLLIPVIASAELEIRFLNIGQGDCAIVICDDESMIIDGGPGSEASMVYTIVKNSLSNVKYLVATHPHEDHVGGLASVLNAVPVDLIFSPVLTSDIQVFKNMLKYAELQRTPIVIPNEGDEYNLGNATITILHCWPEAWTVNDMSIVLRIDYKNISILFTGDAESMSEYMMIDSGLPLKADVLKIGHHGSITSSTMEFLQAVAPRYSVISCGYGNSYGHPHSITLKNLKSIRSTLFRTDLQGTIIMHSDGHEIFFETERETNRDLFISPEEAAAIESENITRSSPSNNASDPDVMFKLDSEVTYVLNTKSHRFHYPYCSGVQDMKPKNRQDFYGTREEAISLGFKPCGNCNP